MSEQTFLAIDAAARSIHANSQDGLANSLAWEDLSPEQVASFWHKADAALTAFKPLLSAAWEEGRQAGWDDIQIEYSVNRNPYE